MIGIVVRVSLIDGVDKDAGLIGDVPDVVSHPWRDHHQRRL